jgi:4-hydroxy-4-methyl-2-oxoglutarate aldolase
MTIQSAKGVQTTNAGALSDASFPTATLHEASGQRGALPSAIKPIFPAFRVHGPAFPVQSPKRDNLWLHRAIYAAQPGDVLVVDVGGEFEAGYWGEIMSYAAAERHLGGLVINGCVRDKVELGAVGFPIFARGLCIRGTTKDHEAVGGLNQVIDIGGCRVVPGDLVVGDEDGVVVVPKEEVATITAAARAREKKEQDIVAQLRAGKSTLEIYRDFR